MCLTPVANPKTSPHITSEESQGGPNLQRVCGDLIGEADATALLLQVDDQSRGVVLDVPHCHLQLPSAVALQAP